jgi:GTP-binding protein HflX
MTVMGRDPLSSDEHISRGRRRLTATVTDLDVVRQRAYLVGVVTKGMDLHTAEASLEELALLTVTAGSDPVESLLQRRSAFDPATLIGSGKAGELRSELKALDIDVVVFDNDLSPAQQRNLQQIFEVDVVDRVALILDIFALHATSRAGMLQVELAQSRYRLPRLRGRGIELSRLGGGIGTRGPGETKLETDRRRIQNRIRKLEKELEDVTQIRATQQKARRRSGIATLTLVGYTNAGKSTLLNTLTGAGVLVEDQLFSTLDSTVRRIQLPSGQEALLSDTVGFVRRLPHQLIEAFRSTLEEAGDADLLLHIVDGADLEAESEIQAVRDVLNTIGAGAVPELLVLNKADIADPTAWNRLRLLHPDAVPISAETGEGTEELMATITKRLAEATTEIDLFVPYDRGDVVAALHRRGEVVSEEHEASGTRVRVRVANEDAARYDDLTVE